MKPGAWWIIAIAALSLGAYAIHKASGLSGGLSSGKRPEDFDPQALRAGTDVELEHTGNRGIAQRIAMDHLVEDPEYYRKLVRAGL